MTFRKDADLLSIMSVHHVRSYKLCWIIIIRSLRVEELRRSTYFSPTRIIHGMVHDRAISRGSGVIDSLSAEFGSNDGRYDLPTGVSAEVLAQELLLTSRTD